MKDGQSEVKEVNGKGTCVGRTPVGEETGNGCFLFVFYFSFSHLEEVHASTLWVLENFSFSLLPNFGILMQTGMDWCV